MTFCSASIYSLIGVSVDRFQAVNDPLGYAKMVAEKNLQSTTFMIIGAWVMSVIISSPMFIDAPGFSNFHHIMNETSIKGHDGCMPPVDPDSLGFVLYSSILAFFIPFIVLGGLQGIIFYKRNHFQMKRVST